MIYDQYLANVRVFHFTTDGWESASISDDDEDGEWVDVHHSSDEGTAGEVVSIKLQSSLNR